VVLRLALAAVGIVLLASACGGDARKQQREDLTTYITKVNRTQIQMRKPLLQVEKAYRDFGKKNGPSLTKLEPRLQQSAATMHMLDRKLRALHPPADAKRLHVLILQLVAEEGRIADEVLELAQFAPRFAVALQPLAPASTALRASFKNAKTARAQADALDAYAVALDGVLEHLRPLKAPPAFAPTLSSQRDTIAGVRASAAALSKGLRQNRRAALPTLIQRFTNAGIANQQLAAQKARIAAIKAYNKRVDSIVLLAHKVDRERLRLGKAFG
jgi:hypothetical protein